MDIGDLTKFLLSVSALIVAIGALIKDAGRHPFLASAVILAISAYFVHDRYPYILSEFEESVKKQSKTCQHPYSEG